MAGAALTGVDDLRTKLGKLEVALSAIVDALVWLDGDGRVQWYNAPFRRLVDRLDAAVLGARLVDLLPLEDGGKPLPPHAHPIHLALNGRPNAIGSYEYRGGGQPVVLEVFAARVQFSRQELSTVVAIRDITERRRAEEKEQRLAAEAADSAVAARKRAAELDTAYKELKNTQAMLVHAEKMAAIGQLASGVAHEVKNPLGIILQGVDYLEGRVGPEDAEGFEVLRMIKEAVMRSDRIVRDLLNFSRQRPLEPKPCDIAQVIRDSLGLVEKQLALQNIAVRQAFADGLPPVVIDENQMKQVFINVILNALQAMPKGGELTLRTAAAAPESLPVELARRALMTWRPGEAAVRCDVADTGVGIPADQVQKAFEPFFTTKPAGQGTGLGLAISRSIVEKHRGGISLASHEGRGTTVTIVLPIVHEVPG
ncbi:MAG: PAS domain-containing protein [Candidatus Omnitrophica bacterium]|nr:PAS domain-containing protein [Candidatus Omnitrophota bacterium]